MSLNYLLSTLRSMRDELSPQPANQHNIKLHQPAEDEQPILSMASAYRHVARHSRQQPGRASNLRPMRMAS